MLHVDCGLVSIGPEAERIWGGRNYMELLSVFDTPELFTVMSGSRELGVLHELSFRRKDAIVLLGGRSWRVSAIDPKRRIAHVESADDQQGRSTWLGSSQRLSFEICQAMRQTLLKPAATLSRRASEEMETLAAEATVDQDGTVLRTARNGCEWWTYAGLKGNAALAREFALPCTFDSMCVRAHCSPVELKRSLDSRAHLTSPKPDPHFRPKFAECIPDKLLALFAWKRLYDWAAAKQIEQFRIVDVC